MADKSPSRPQPVGKPVPAREQGRRTAPPTPRRATPIAAGQQSVAAKSRDNADGEEEGEDEEAEHEGGNNFLLFNAVPSWVTSMIVHIIMLIILAFITLENPFKSALNELIIGEEDVTEEVEDFEEEDVPEIDVETPTTEVAVQDTSVVIPQEVTEISPANDLDAAPIAVELEDVGDRTAPKNDLLAAVGAYAGNGLSGRGASARSALVRKNGGTAGSENAVALALQWFANHQNPDGSWSFDHRVSPMCQGRCPDHGSITEARNGATAMALLPFLGAGQTHREGKYKQVVYRGLYYLITKQRESTQGPGGLWEERGHMYSHGLCSIALCEAYGMTRDRELMQPAQLSLDFISSAQDPVGGGWRYQVKERGDTSVVGWQLMALKSGHMAYLNVNPNTIKAAYKYLDGVQADSGAAYGYTDPGNGQATSAIGLLSRMYLGWKKDHGPLQRGAERLSGIGPSDHNMYYNYYATQIMRHLGGDMWEKWNPEMRDYLVNSQNKAGHTKGSWNFQDPHGASGGRIYCTALATMILEVYYRHMPIYQKAASEDDFEL